MKTKVFYFLFSFLVGALALFGEQSHTVVRRAAFDIGSGQVKMQVSDVDLTINKIAKVLFTDTMRVPLREDLNKSVDGKLSAQIQDKLVHSISILMKEASVYHPEEHHGVATEGLRLAKDVHQLLQRIQKETGLTITIISQKEEGILGFVSAVSVANLDPVKAISWDFGGGSLQMTMKSGSGYSVYQNKLGKVPFKNALLDIQGKNLQLSPNPIVKSEIPLAVEFIKEQLIDVPPDFLQKIKEPETAFLGIGINPLYGMKDSERYNKKRLFQEIEKRLNLTDNEIRVKDAISVEYRDSAQYVVSNLILAYGFMEALGVQEVRYVGTPGANTIGLLLSPQYWSSRQ